MLLTQGWTRSLESSRVLTNWHCYLFKSWLTLNANSPKFNAFILLIKFEKEENSNKQRTIIVVDGNFYISIIM